MKTRGTKRLLLSLTLLMAPDGRIEPLMWIPDWDSSWPGHYRYTAPLQLPAGTRIDVETIYDNPSANPRHRIKPPRDVHFGEQTTDEMAQLSLTVAIERQTDADTLKHAIRTHGARWLSIGGVLRHRLQRRRLGLH